MKHITAGQLKVQKSEHITREINHIDSSHRKKNGDWRRIDKFLFPGR